MARPFLFAAAVANFFLIASSSAKVGSYAHSSASSSSGYAPSSAHSDSFAITTSGHPQYHSPPCDTSSSNKPCRTKQRPKCYNKYEEFSNCPAAVCRPKTCDEVGYPVACVDLKPNGKCPVPPGCICIEHYVRGPKGNCIPMKDCPSCGGDCNAESGCNSNCNQLCSNLNEKPGVCTAECIYNSCECKKGYVFDEITEKCVHPSRCTCKSNEVFTDCEENHCGPKSCAQLKIKFPAHCLKVDPKYCTKGCICKEGYIRNRFAECIPIDQCPPICGPNEFPSNCMQADCAPQNCTQLGFPIVCVRVDQKHCKKGCLCKEGYARNCDGVCIPVKECPSCGGDPNAELAECASNCGRLCSNYNRTDVVCTLECAINGCQCKKGYVFDTNTNRCVLPCDCTPTCGPHEVFTNCTQGNCAPQKCTELGYPIPCPRVDPKYCKKGCLCEPGYVRNSAGVCIPVKKCPSCGGDPNAEGAECASNCGRLCSNYNRTDVVCTLECVINGCQCKKGYVFDTNTNKCVLPCDCTPTCGKHEVYSTCMQADCAPKNCTQLGFPVPCPRVDPKYCKEGCLCKPGYVRNSAGVCIPVKDCPSCGGDPNAEGAECASNCGRLCSNYNRTDVVCTLECAINGCQCKKGYVFDTNTDRCVLPCDCTPTCGDHEVFSTCTQANCAPQKCTQLGFPIPCPRVDPKYCKKGCLCKPGYVRNSADVCIPVENCPSCGGDPNAEGAECASNCGRLCSNYNQKDVVCPLVCQLNGCQCKKGYVYDSNTNRCVLPCDCTPVCNKYEMYSECINNPCPVINCSHVGLWVDCLQFDTKCCIKGCVCQAPLMREDDGSCVPIEECKTPVCKKNEVYSECINGGCTPKNCSEKGLPIKCVKIDPKYCIEGCLCKEGYLREDDGTCVPEKKCKIKCTKPNEYYDPCGYDCPSQSCKSINKKQHCPIQTCDNCKPLCKCKDGFYRNLIGECITKKQCLQCPGEKEYWSCGGACDNVCKDLHKQNQANCPIVNIKCNEMCYCVKDHARAKNGTCIPISKCNEPQCCENERYEKCPARLTEPQKCSELGYPLPDPPCCDDDKCPVKPACVCISGYVRNYKGVCIPKKDCPKCGGDPYAEAGCGNNCNKTCEDILKKPDACILGCKNNSCDCKKGYYYNKEKKKCVLPSECGLCTKPNEYLEMCDYGCPPNTCESLNRAYVCPIREGDKCSPRCKCKPGFFRNKNGECITEKQCRKCMGPNEYWSCGGACDNVCKDLHKQNQTNCPIVNIKCNEMCYCVTDHARAKNGTCIPISKCNEPQCCKNERYEKCPARLTEPQKCSELGCPLPDPPCCDDDKCPVKPACVCISGYVRNDKGVCIPKKDCPPVCKKNEVYSECINGGCTPKNCSEKGLPIKCVKIDPKYCIEGCLCKEGYLREDDGTCVPEKKCKIKCTKPNEYYDPCGYDCPSQSCKSINKTQHCPIQTCDNCKPLCKCKDGFYRNLIGECITKKQCLQCPGEKEYWSCGGACDNVCKDLHKQNQANCPIVNIKCNEMCYCVKDHARAKNGTCIPISKCNEPQCCENERYEKCPARLTEPQKCSELGYPLPDPPYCDDDKCPVKPACVCISGYVRNYKGVCIPKKDCPKCGGDPYAEAGCGNNCNKTCEDILKKPDACILGCKNNSCDCKKGYYYNKEKKKCVLPSECGLCTKPNEYLEMCDYGCPPNTCESLNRAYVCPIREGDKCSPRCKCKPGFFRNKKGECITEKQCRKCMGPNEYWSCGGACDNVCKDLHKQNQTNCPIVNIKCNEMCYCVKDHARAKNGTCIPISKCNEPQCCKNERYEKCPARLTEPQKCSELGCPLPDPPCCDDDKCPVKPACVCISGYVRNDKGVCIPKKDCPPVCKGANEVYEDCTQPSCKPRKCSELGFPLNCTEPPACEKGCTCKDGYVRNKKGICITLKECGTCGGDDNAESGSGVNCLKKCYDLQYPDNPKPCPKIYKVNACDCKEGFYLDEIKNKCVPPKKCPYSCPENEVEDSCVNGGCGHRNCSELGGPILCIDPIECYRGCTCKEGYLRLDCTGKCVPEKQCPE